MKDLQAHLESLGLKEVRTYIQSGNAVFKSDHDDMDIIRKKIEAKIEEVYGFAVTVFIIQPDKLKEYLRSNPFSDYDVYDRKKMYFVFLNKPPQKEKLDILGQADFSPEQWSYEGSIIYLYAQNGYGRSILDNNYFEKKLTIEASTRNLNTIEKLIEMSQ